MTFNLGAHMQRIARGKSFSTAMLKTLVIASCLCIVTFASACAPSQPSADSASGQNVEAPAQAEVEAPADDGQVDEESESIDADSVEDVAADDATESSVDTSDLSARDQEFALDPDRTTDWNYDGSDKKTVYLTIDDGPSENTEKVLDILDQYGCKATFFVVGLDSNYYPMIKEAYDRGHTIGLHSDTHDYATVYSSEDAYFADLDAIGQIVKDQVGYVPCFIRFPGGSSNMISADYCPGIMSALVDAVQERGYQYYDWNMSVGDGAVHTADEIVGYATEPTELTNIVLLCHDSATKQTTVEALPRIIEHYQELGYTFEAIDRSSFVPHHGVGN